MTVNKLQPGGERPLPGALPMVRLPDAGVVGFITTECELADTHQYGEWESLWDHETGLYWVCGPGDCDHPDAGFREVSYVYDNRTRIASRIRQLKTTRRISQVPMSSLSRVISGFRLAVEDDRSVIGCWINFIVSEFRAERSRLWAGKALYRLRDTPDGLRMIEKRIVLVDRSTALDTFTFIL